MRRPAAIVALSCLDAESIAFMIKRAPGARPASGDWEFRYFPEPPNADYSGCVECHRTGA